MPPPALRRGGSAALLPQVRLARLVALDLPIDADGAPKADGAHGGSFFVVGRTAARRALLHLLKPEADGGLVAFGVLTRPSSRASLPLPSEDAAARDEAARRRPAVPV